MDISKFDFTKFSKEKWQEVLTKIGGDYNIIEDVKVNYDVVNNEIIPSVTIEYYYTTDADSETFCLTFTAFELQSEGEDLTCATKEWRIIMIKEFGDAYYNSLVNHLKLVKEQKIQQLDEEYENELRDINNFLYL